MVGLVPLQLSVGETLDPHFFYSCPLKPALHPTSCPSIIALNFSAAQVFALHPLYLSLPAMAPSSMPTDIAKSIDEARKELDGPAVDYERTLATKLAIARRIFHAVGQAELKVC